MPSGVCSPSQDYRLAKQIASTVGWRRVAYRLVFAYVFDKKVGEMMQPLYRATMNKLGVPRNAPLKAAHSTLWLSGEKLMGCERITMLMKMLRCKDARGMAMAGAVQRLQQYVGCEQPVLETKLYKCDCLEKCAREEGCRSG